MLEINTSEQKSAGGAKRLKRLRLENFQSHRDTTLDFDPNGINIIRGTSNCGKSSIFRALNFLFSNQPRGSSFVRYGCSETRITAHFSDGTVVVRAKGHRNSVYVQHSDGREETFENFGDKLPEEVKEAMGSPPFDKEHGPLAYAAQEAKLFLVNLSPTELPRALSELTGIAEIESAAARLATQARLDDREAKNSAARISEYNSDLEAYKDLQAEEESIQSLEAKFCNLDTLIQQWDRGSDLLEKFAKITVSGRSVHALVQEATRVAQLSSVLNPLGKKMQDLTEGHNLCKRYQEIERSEKLIQARLKELSCFVNPECEVAIKQIFSDLAVLREGDRLLKSFKGVCDSGLKLRQALHSVDEKERELEAEIENLVEEMKAMGIWCEVCDRPLPFEEEHLHA